MNLDLISTWAAGVGLILAGVCYVSAALVLASIPRPWPRRDRAVILLAFAFAPVAASLYVASVAVIVYQERSDMLDEALRERESSGWS